MPVSSIRSTHPRLACHATCRRAARLVGVALAGLVIGTTAGAAEDASTEVQRLIRSGQTTQASDRLDKALAERPRDPQLRFLRGVLQTDAGQQAAAIDTFDQLAVDHPELPEPYNNLAVLHASQGDYARAKSELEAALRARPGYAIAYQNLGDVYLQLSRQAYQQALALDPSNAAIAPKLALLRDLGAAPVAPSTSTSTSKQLAP
jgi:Flp pilus assembly protein TadD